MRYLKTSSMVGHNLNVNRVLLNKALCKALWLIPLFVVLCFFASTAQADVMQDCTLKEKTPQDVHDCVVAAQQRSMNELRSLGLAMTKKFRTGDDKRGFRRYAEGESHLVRDRKNHCVAAGKQAAKQQLDAEQANLACQADFNFSHAQELKRRYPE